VTIRTDADKYLRKFALYNLVLGCLTAFFGLIAVAFSVFAGGMMMQSAMPTAASGMFGAAMVAIAVFVLIFSGLYFATWHFAKKRSAVAVYGMTGLLGLATLFNAITFNIIAFPISLLGVYWGYKSFDAV
jgi:FlaA1/EpsC-like NDP-sugar epimerase